MRAMNLDDQIEATVPGTIIGRAEAPPLAAFLSRDGGEYPEHFEERQSPEEPKDPALKPTYYVTCLEYPDNDGQGSGESQETTSPAEELVVRYQVGHRDEAAARFDFAAFFYPMMNLARTANGEEPLGPEELIEAKLRMYEQNKLMERLAYYGVRVGQSEDKDEASFWRTAEITLREEAETRIPDPELREMLESFARLKEAEE